jgi:hypothetical protein
LKSEVGIEPFFNIRQKFIFMFLECFYIKLITGCPVVYIGKEDIGLSDGFMRRSFVSDIMKA